ncbi:hypothetical protein SASPL_107668 [Salvia splendens]|uniref:Protein NLRC3 n=1 Tax=Salvia splendens TaxID=180675 RepID=A0A8X8YGU0_SALSN|nr:hypothetical protein SASPL_107668 [Salvia splendens]
MVSTSALSLSSHLEISFAFRSKHTTQLWTLSSTNSSSLRRRGTDLGRHFTLVTINSEPLSSRKFEIRAAAAGGGSSRRSGSSRRVYQESQAQTPIAPVTQAASYILPAGAFVIATFVLWKLVEKILVPKLTKSVAEEDKPASGEKWSFSQGINFLSPSGAKVERESRMRLNDFARELRSFSSIDMSGRNFGDEGLFFLAESLAYNQTAEEVSFAANGITAKGIMAFDGILQSNIALKSLNLSGNSIGDEGVKCLCDILVKNSGIQKLQLSSSAFGDEGAKAIAEMLKKNSTLRIIELNNNLIDYSGFSSIAGALLENKTILSIYLNGNYGGPLGASALAKGLEGNKSLRELYLQGNSFGDEGVIALMSGLSSHKGKLTVLDLANNSIGARGASHVAEYIKKSKSLLLINLYMNDIGDEGAEKVAEALKDNRSVTNVDLGGNDIHAKGISAIARILKDNSVISALEIGYNPIGPDGAKALAEVLKFHGNVKDLMLGWCQIGATGAEDIADMLRYNSTISSLDLRANGLRDEGAICLARSLKIVNESLVSLNLGFNEIRDEGAFAIAQALKSNEDVRLTSLNLMNNFLTKLGQSAITDASDHVLEMNEKELTIGRTKKEIGDKFSGTEGVVYIDLARASAVADVTTEFPPACGNFVADVRHCAWHAWIRNSVEEFAVLRRSAEFRGEFRADVRHCVDSRGIPVYCIIVGMKSPYDMARGVLGNFAENFAGSSAPLLMLL